MAPTHAVNTFSNADQYLVVLKIQADLIFISVQKLPNGYAGFGHDTKKCQMVCQYNDV
jgi:hypothetical protein